MEQFCGRLPDPLDPHALSELQSAILGVSTIRPGLRESPVFVGSRSVGFGSVTHYVCPHWEWLPEMLEGLRRFLASTDSSQSLIRAAVASFGFVFIHPLADGNADTPGTHRRILGDGVRWEWGRALTSTDG